ncbi:MAG TPA: hypothetical protein DCE39_13545 [Planctomycetaceae bacterium]|nr:hypothetical protein [Planctomycetaceae bacterium]
MFNDTLARNRVSPRVSLEVRDVSSAVTRILSSKVTNRRPTVAITLSEGSELEKKPKTPANSSSLAWTASRKSRTRAVRRSFSVTIRRSSSQTPMANSTTTAAATSSRLF